jgi:hypothetical protein
VGCLYAQVRSCAAPCLSRVSEEEYRSLAGAAARLLGSPAARPEPPAWLPAFVATGAARALIVEPCAKDVLELYPVTAGVVADDPARASLADLEAALAGLRWEAPGSPGRDEAWLSAWLHEPRRRGLYLVLEDDEAAPPLYTRIRERIRADAVIT